MEQQVIFVLGALSGLVATMLVYAFAGVLRISQKLKNISRNLEDIERRGWDNDREHRDYINREAESLRNSIDHLYRELFQRIETVERETDERFKETQHSFWDAESQIGRRISDVCDRIDAETTISRDITFDKFDDCKKYVDSRVDQAIDHLNKRFGPQGTKEPTLIKS